MYYGNIKKLDIANGDGVRVSLFVSGCRNRCEGCFQPETWNFEFGQPFTRETEETILKALEPSYVNGLTLLGGEPFEPENQRELVKLLRKIRADYPEKNVWCYSGYTVEQIMGDGHPHCEVSGEMLSMIDVLVDGRFTLALKDISLRFRGSSNQRIIDLKASRERGEIVLWNGI
ncbi:MAG: anaerobic ribonucleoside-triphosphate reductase activating protein [Clostridia bacterium]|nr:anaerobic ribonucleoside-triphosphate reductase activating protein [Clostridia bacterium]